MLLIDASRLSNFLRLSPDSTSLTDKVQSNVDQLLFGVGASSLIWAYRVQYLEVDQSFSVSLISELRWAVLSLIIVPQ